MRNVSLLTLAAAVAAVVSTTPVHAGNDASYVDLGGADGGTCADGGAQRCRSLSHALAQTNPGGIVYCLTGVDNGAITISQAVTIECSGTNTTVSSSGAALTINAPAGVVTIRGLRIHGTSATGGTSGINITSAAAVVLDDVQVEHMRAPGSGIVLATSALTRLDISNSLILDTGGNVTSAGILIKPTGGGGANVSVSRTDIKGNVNGIFVDDSGGGGAVNLTVRDSVVTGNSNVGIVLVTPGPAVSALIDRTTITANSNVGVAVSGAAAIARIGNSTIYGNVTGVTALSGGTLRSYKNNALNGNLTDGGPITAEGEN
jgi:hypothetical protein